MSRPGWASEPGDAWRWRLDGSDATSRDCSITVLADGEPDPGFGFARVLHEVVARSESRTVSAVAQSRGWKWVP